MPWNKYLRSAFVGAFLSAIIALPVFADEKLKIVITNDVHGYIDFRPEEGRFGLARLKGYLDSLADQGYQVFLLDAGDAFSGGVYAQVDRGLSVARIMGLMGYRVLTPGNHAFDHNEASGDSLYYSRVLLPAIKESAHRPLEVTAVNLSFKGGAVPGVGREVVIIHDESADNEHGLRVIVAGVITPYPRSYLTKEGYDFGRVRGDGPEAALATRQKILDELTAAVKPYDRPGDIVIILSHVGSSDRTGAGEALGGQDLAVIPNVDFIADGHSHGVVTPVAVGEATYANGGRHLEKIMEITVEAGRATMELRGWDEISPAGPDPAIEAAIAAIDARYRLDEVLFYLPDPSLRPSRDQVTPLGRFLTRAMAEASEADLALYGSGAIRNELKAGPVKVRDVYDVIPFETDMLTVRMTGREMALVMESLSKKDGWAAQFYGPKVYGWRDEVGMMKVVGMTDAQGCLIEPEKTYFVTINGFMYNGSRGLGFRDKAVVKNSGNLTSAVIEKLRLEPDFDLKSIYAENIFEFENQTRAMEALEKAAEVEWPPSGSNLPEQQGALGPNSFSD